MFKILCLVCLVGPASAATCDGETCDAGELAKGSAMMHMKSIVHQLEIHEDEDDGEGIRKFQMNIAKVETHANETNPTTPTPITSSNKGRCYPGKELSKDTKGYTWWIGDEQRCTSVYIPPSAPKPMPVVFEMECYSKDKKTPKQFGRFPVAKFLLSTSFKDSRGSGAWRTGNDGVVNDQRPQPCSSDDSPEILYVKAIFDLVDADPATFDANKIYTYGFSQNSMFSAYVGFCFSHKVAGIVQAGSGMVVTADGGRPMPNNGGLCKYSDYLKLGKTCAKKKKCDECQYWPIYPCYDAAPVVYCTFIYEKDFAFQTQKAMYDRAVLEGFDSRYFEFPGGGHKSPKNSAEWYAGCWGITAACSASCVTDFKACVEQSDYSQCVESGTFPSSCSPGCSPTLDMLALSEATAVTELSQDTFGSSSGKEPRGESSKCEHDSARSPSAPAPGPRLPSPAGGTPPSPPAPAPHPRPPPPAGKKPKWMPPACSATRSQRCCGDGRCQFPETEANCAADCEGK